MSNSQLSTVAALFADLDALMDARLATLYTFGESVVEAALKAGYLNRPIDQFRDVDPKEFKHRYDNRVTNKEIIRNLTLTPLVSLVKEFVYTINAKKQDTPEISKPKLYINIYPYNFNEEEQKVFLDVFVTITKGTCDIEIVRMSNEDLTPKFVKDNLALILKYDYIQWLELHSANENFKKTMCPEVSLFGPAIYFEKLPDVIELKKMQDSKMTAFSAMELTVKPLISLKLLNIDSFSIALGVDPSKVNTDKTK